LATEPVLQEQELRSEALTVQQRAQAIVIRDQATYNQAAEMLRAVKSFRSRWTSYWEPLRENAYTAYKGIMGKINEGDHPLEQAERSLKRALLDWDDEQRRIQERLQAEAQRKAEEEEAARRAQLAFEMEDAGAEEAQIEEVVSAPVVVVAEAVAPTYQKASGVSRRSNWKARVTDLKKLAKAVAAGKVPVEYILPNQQALDNRAKADQTTMNVPGVESYDDPVIAGRF
jgi:hypothetical protein